MYPEIPLPDITWPITQHAGVINRNVIEILLNVCIQFNGQQINRSLINQRIVDSKILTPNVRADSNRIDAWRDYQQILSELGLIYSTRITRDQLILTPIAIEFLDGGISYEELITLQLFKYQYPNGHKTQLSPNLKYGFALSIGANTFTDVQYSLGILLRPAVLLFSVLDQLLRQGEIPVLTVDELQTYVVRCLTNADAVMCASYIVNSRKNKQYILSPLPRARRNMQDWIKLLVQTPIFDTPDFTKITLSNFALNHIEEIRLMCDNLSNPDTFWIYNGEADFKFNWYSFFGNINLNHKWIPIVTNPENATDSQSYIQESIEDSQIINLNNKTEINLRKYTPVAHKIMDSNHRQIISNYDYAHSQRGYYLHDSMVDFIAKRCVDKGAEVYEDKSSIDLFIKYNGREYLIEVKSVTPNNFIQRLRSAIGQVNQYDYLFSKVGERRLGLGFTANIPNKSWVIPFVTSYLNMDLLIMDADDLLVRTNNSHSASLFGM